MKVAICIPSTDDWRADFAMSVAGLVSYAAKTPAPNGEPIDIKIFNMRFAYVTYSRNCMFREALAWKADWILHAETDMYFPKDALHALLHWNEDCVVANFAPRRAKDPKLANNALQRGNAVCTGTAVKNNAPLPWMRSGNGLSEVDYAAFGLVLVRATVLRAIKPPWANFEGPADIVADSCETTNNQFSRNAFLSDDYYFCRRLRDHGYKIHVDLSLSQQVRHVGVARFSPRGPECTGLMFEA